MVNNKLAEKPKTLEERIAELEATAKKHSTAALVISIITVLVGGTGIAGIIQYAGGSAGRDADVRLKNAEAAAHDLSTASKRHDSSIKSLTRLIKQLEDTGKTTDAESIRSIMISQEAEFQLFIRSMTTAMMGIWNSAEWRHHGEAGRTLTNYRQSMNRALNGSKRRIEILEALASPEKQPP